MMNEAKRRVCILGSTGSVGQNTLDVIRQHSSRFQVVGLACGQSVEKFAAQILEFRPQYVSLANASAADTLRNILSPNSMPEIFVGVEGHRDLVEASRPDILMASMAGTHGLQATLQGIRQGVKILGIANKEVLVMAGSFINEALASSPTFVIPVDSEHSAIFQALQGNRREDVRRLILTASGGPFRTWPIENFSKIKPADALKHPNWSMGSKITVDSATLMNKGLEYIEALQLFKVEAQQIDIWVHPQSIIHSLVEYRDSSFIAQLGISDMRIPIAYALSYPERLALNFQESLSLDRIRSLNFEAPDYEKFPCLRLAINSLDRGPAGPLILNAANEVAVNAFLAEALGFTQIPVVIESALEYFSGKQPQNLQDAIELDLEVKNWTQALIERQNKKSYRSVSL